MCQHFNEVRESVEGFGDEFGMPAHWSPLAQKRTMRIGQAEFYEFRLWIMPTTAALAA
jgi:hypothetical protein